MAIFFKQALFFLLCLLPNSRGQSTSSWNNVVESTCKFTTNHDLSISFEQNPLLFIKQVNMPDASSCRRMCCDHKTCNGYVWDASDSQPCKLLKCSDEGTDCKNALAKRRVADKSRSEVGFITGITDTTPSNLPVTSFDLICFVVNYFLLSKLTCIENRKTC